MRPCVRALPAPPAPTALAEEPPRGRLVGAPGLRFGLLVTPARRQHPGAGRRLGRPCGLYEVLVQDKVVPVVCHARFPSTRSRTFPFVQSARTKMKSLSVSGTSVVHQRRRLLLARQRQRPQLLSRVPGGEDG